MYMCISTYLVEREYGINENGEFTSQKHVKYNAFPLNNSIFLGHRKISGIHYEMFSTSLGPS
jgi:hypothetical protein